MPEDVKIGITADTQGFLKQLKRANTGVMQMRKVVDDYHKAGIRGALGMEKSLGKLEKARHRLAKQTFKEQRDMQKALKVTAGLIDKEHKSMIKQGVTRSLHLDNLNKRYDQQIKALRTIQKEAGVAEPRFRKLRQAMGAVGRGAASVGAQVGGGLFGMLMGAVMQGYQAYMQYGQAKGTMIGMGAQGRGVSQMLGGARRAGGRYAYTPIETIQMSHMMARSTGAMGGARNPASAQLMAATRATGLGAGEAAQTFSALRIAGYDFEPGKGKNQAKESEGLKRFEKVIKAGLASGLERGRLPEFLGGVNAVLEQMRQMMPGKLNVGAVAGQLAGIGKLMGPEFTGRAGVGMMGMMQQAFASPAGGTAGQMFMMRAMGFGGPGAQQTSLMEATRRQEHAAAGVTTVDESMNLINQIKKEAGTREEQIMTAREMFKTTVDMAEKLVDLDTTGKTQKEIQDQIKEAMEAGKSIDEQALDAQKGMAGELKHIVRVMNHDIAIGAKVADDMQKLQIMQMHFIEQMLSALLKIKDMIAAIIEKSPTWGGKATLSQLEKQWEEDPEAVERLRKLAKVDPAGAAEQIRIKAKKARGLAQKAHQQLTGERSFGELFVDEMLTQLSGELSGLSVEAEQEKRRKELETKSVSAHRAELLFQEADKFKKLKEQAKTPEEKAKWKAKQEEATQSAMRATEGGNVNVTNIVNVSSGPMGDPTKVVAKGRGQGNAPQGGGETPAAEIVNLGG